MQSRIKYTKNKAKGEKNQANTIWFLWTLCVETSIRTKWIFIETNEMKRKKITINELQIVFCVVWKQQKKKKI